MLVWGRMAMVTLELVGTWEEIAAHEADFAGRRLRVQVLPTAAGGQDDPRLPILQEIDARSRSMNPKPDARDHRCEGHVQYKGPT
jgi:hypothetical protein